MFLNQLSEPQQLLFLSLASMVTAVDNDYNDSDHSVASNPVEKLANMFTDVAIQFSPMQKSAMPLKKALFGQPEDVSKLVKVEVEINALKKLLETEGTLDSRQIERTIDSAYNDFEKMLSELKEDIDDDEKSSVNDLKLKYATKLCRRYFNDSKLSDLSSVAVRVFIVELYSISLADGVISELEDKLISKISKIFEMEDFLIQDLKNSALSINRAIVETLAIISE
jgi:hypothetical protein